MTKYTDEELLRFLTGGRELQAQAFAELYDRHSSRVYLYCRRIVGNDDDASDALQETFLSFLQRARDGGDIRSVPAYLFRIARNFCLRTLGGNAKTNVPFEDFHSPCFDRPLESIELEQLIENALAVLPVEYREAFVLQTYNELSYREIAEVTNVPITTVRNRVVRAKVKLRDLLAAYVGAQKH